MSNLLSSNEFELKFEIPPARLKNVAVALLNGKVTRQRLQASYFDTSDGALAAHGIVVRLRKEDRRWVQTAKGPTVDLLQRLEHNVVLPFQPSRTVPVPDLSRHRETPVGKAIDRALARKADDNYPNLNLLYGTEVQRITRLVACSGSMVEVALDQGCVFADGHSQSICELEVELKQGSPWDAVVLAQQWSAEHGLWVSTIAKSMKGQRLRNTTPCDAVTSVNSAKLIPKFSRHASGHEMLTAVVQACLNQILPNMSELASGSNHPDHIHQLRVGIRRLRTALRELGSLTNATDPSWEAILVKVFRTLGAHRDHNYLALVQQPQLLQAGGPVMRFGDGSLNIPDVCEAVRAPDFQNVLLGLVGFVHSEAPEPIDKTDALKKVVSLRLDKLHVRALRDGKKFIALGEAQQHDVRKRFKRLRYLLEFCELLFPARKLKHMTAALKPVQDALGMYNDELMALSAWRTLATDEPKAWFGIGWLSARRQCHVKRCLKEIKAFAKIKPFWL